MLRRRLRRQALRDRRRHVRAELRLLLGRLQPDDEGVRRRPRELALPSDRRRCGKGPQSGCCGATKDDDLCDSDGRCGLPPGACRGQKATCANDGDCCSSHCDPASKTCTTVCAAASATCTTGADCCSSSCTNGRCDAPRRSLPRAAALDLTRALRAPATPARRARAASARAIGTACTSSARAAAGCVSLASANQPDDHSVSVGGSGPWPGRDERRPAGALGGPNPSRTAATKRSAEGSGRRHRPLEERAQLGQAAVEGQGGVVVARDRRSAECRSGEQTLRARVREDSAPDLEVRARARSRPDPRRRTRRHRPGSGHRGARSSLRRS